MPVVGASLLAKTQAQSILMSPDTPLSRASSVLQGAVSCPVRPIDTILVHIPRQIPFALKTSSLQILDQKDRKTSNSHYFSVH